MAFIHGAVAWNGRDSDIGSGVDAMVSALDGRPWSSSDSIEIRSRASSGRLASQRFDPPVASAGRDRAGDRAVEVVADLRLDELASLRSPVAVGDGASAAELVAAHYRRNGERCLTRFLGDGTFALWDREAERLICWRDAAGTRPLYYRAVEGRHVVFSSDLRSLTAHPLVPRLLDLAFTRSVLEIGHTFHHPSRTACDGVLKVPAGHALVADRHRCTLVRHWDPRDLAERRYRDESEYVEELRGLLGTAVACRVPEGAAAVGAHLSGGLDSSSVAVVAQRTLADSGRTVRGMSWAPPYDMIPALATDDERTLAAAVADSAGIPLHFTSIQPSDFLEIERRDMPLQPTTTLHGELAASRAAAAAGVTTILSGWGGDELAVFNGRGYFADLARRGRWLRLRRELRARSDLHEASPLATLRGRVLLPLIPTNAVQRFRPELDLETYSLPPSLRPEFRRELLGVDALPDRRPRVKPGVRQMQTALLEYGHLQYRMDSWASHGADLGVTYRFPLLDRRIMEFALTVPDHLYFQDGWKRWLYRSATQGILPDDVRWHPRKHDTALEQRLRDIRVNIGPEGRAQLRTRGQNPYIDVERLIEPGPSAALTHAAPPTPYPAMVWLAFTDVSSA